MTITNDRAAWIKGGSELCSLPPRPNPQPIRLVLLGAPGVGKGTQAELLHVRLGACQLSTGDVFRAAGKICEGERSPALTAALAFMKHGDLVPDATVLEMVRERARCLRCYGGILLDGFPRTVAQAEVLDQLFLELGVRLNAAISYDLPIEKIVARLSGRRTCEKCKAVFHTETLPSKSPGVCDHCGGGLVQREDDQPDAVRIRMHAYESSTAPLADYYRQRNLLLSIPACGSPEEIFTRTISALNTFK